MQRLITIFILLFIISGSFAIQAFKPKEPPASKWKTTPLTFKIPKGWPAPQYDFKNNPLTKEGYDLGKKLFYDGRLSKDGNFSCATCHQQFAAFSTIDHDFSHGFNNTLTTRNAPALFNLAWQKDFMWDGGINHLDLQPLAPITATNEMGEAIDSVLTKIRGDKEYRKLFKKAFGTELINTQRMTKALSQFLLMMVSCNSKYDRVMSGKDSFNLPQRLGYEIFKAKCTSCHKEPMFTDYSFRNTGLTVNNTINDFGRLKITGNRADSLKFRVPSLRNVQVTFPYGHDGRFYDLDQVMVHYRSKVVNGPTTDSLVKKGIVLSNFEIGQIKAFLYTLTDSVFLKNKKFGINESADKSVLLQ